MASEFTIRSDSVDVEQIMEQIRARIREKRGVDYTEEQIRELAGVKLEKFLDPRGVRSDLLEQFRQAPPSPRHARSRSPAATTRSRTTRSSSRARRRRPHHPARPEAAEPAAEAVLQPEPAHPRAAHPGRRSTRSTRARSRRTVRSPSSCNYEVIHNLVVEMTRLGIEVKNLKMRVESLSSRLEFNERRARALEGVVQYKPGSGPAARRHAAPPGAGAGRSPHQRDSRPRRESRQAARRPAGARAARARPARAGPGESGQGQAGGVIKGEAQRSRRRRRRRGRGERRRRRRRAAGRGRRAERRCRGGARRRPELRRAVRRRAPAARRSAAVSESADRDGQRPDEPTTSEARGRRPALRPRHQRRRRAARALHRRAPGAHAEVEVLTTCARDYVTWRNELPAGESRRSTASRAALPGAPRARRRALRPALGPRVRASRTRSPTSSRGSTRGADEPGARRATSRTHAGGVRLLHLLQLPLLPRVPRHPRGGAAGRSSCRRPSATRRSASSIFGPMFRGVRALMYNSFEERAMIQAVAGNDGVPGVVVGVGSEVPARTEPGAVPPEVRHHGPVRVYVGRIDENKGCKELFDFFQRYSRARRGASCPSC